MSINFKIVSIEGNIGSGKSTLLENLRTKYSDNKYIIFLREPVDEWEKIKDVEGNTILKQFYADKTRYSFPFQMMAYISRLKILRDTVNLIKQSQEEDLNKEYIIITERSLFTDRYVFAAMLWNQGHIEDICYQIYLTWFNEFATDFPITYSVYVKTDAEICYDRIHKRARNGEELIPLDYLEECHVYHEEFLDETKGIQTTKIVLDGNMDIFEDENTVKEWLETINSFIL
jgi:deoxyadenosine/deoxycytidine kinase